MAKFKYQAITPAGLRIQGKAEGITAQTVSEELVAKGLDVRSIKERASILHLEITKKKVKLANVMHFSRQMAAFVRAGVPILDSLQILSEETKDRSLRKVMIEVAEALRAGERFSDAISVHKKVFPPFYVSVLASAETTGQLDLVLDQLSHYIERDLEARRKIKGALAYPAVLIVMSIVVVTILAVFVLPRFTKFFESFDAELPLPTRMLMAATAFLSQWWWALLSGAAILLITFLIGVRTKSGRELKDRTILKVPLVGTVARYAVVERFCRILSAMVQAGVDLPEAMRLATEGAHNLAFERPLKRARDSMMEGGGIAQPMSRIKLFPRAITQMMRVGEDTGTLDSQLDSMASYYEKELEYKLKNLTTLFEPIAIVIMGLIVGFVAVALVSAMYGIFNQVKV